MSTLPFFVNTTILTDTMQYKWKFPHGKNSRNACPTWHLWQCSDENLSALIKKICSKREVNLTNMMQKHIIFCWLCQKSTRTPKNIAENIPYANTLQYTAYLCTSSQQHGHAHFFRKRVSSCHVTHLAYKERVVCEFVKKMLFSIGLATFRRQGALQLPSNVKNK